MDRRKFLQASLGAGLIGTSGGIAMPALARGAAARTLRFVPQSNLANFDPIWGTQYVVRNAAMLVWDTLYGVDETVTPRRQMVESEQVSADGLVWTFKLRSGMTFHDGEPVRAKDAVASLARWAARDQMGLMIKSIENELVAVDDLTFKWSLKKPFPKMLLALGKSNAPCTFVMPERIAKTDPFQQIKEYIGSGPMKFVQKEWVPGAIAVFEKFDGYKSREEPSSWLAGSKRMLLDRVEWVIMPDPGTASAALQNGEVDWLETPLTDLLPVLRATPGISVDVVDRLGNVGVFRMNHLLPPFDKVEIRRAVLTAMNQGDYMRAIVGDDDSLWKPMLGFFTPGTKFYTEQGGDILKKKDLNEAKRMLEKAGYDGTPVTCLVAQDLFGVKEQGDVTADLLRRMGMNVDFVATDWGTVGARRASKKPPKEGGWNMFHTWHSGSDCVSPAGYYGLRGTGEAAWFGWPTSPKTEEGIAAWYDATDLEAEKAALARTSQAAMDDVVFGLTGGFLNYQAWRSNVKGIGRSPMPVAWDVSKEV